MYVSFLGPLRRLFARARPVPARQRRTEQPGALRNYYFRQKSGPVDGLLDPGETVTVELGIVNNGDPGATTTNLVATLQAVSGVLSRPDPRTTARSRRAFQPSCGHLPLRSTPLAAFSSI